MAARSGACLAKASRNLRNGVGRGPSSFVLRMRLLPTQYRSCLPVAEQDLTRSEPHVVRTVTFGKRIVGTYEELAVSRDPCLPRHFGDHRRVVSNAGVSRQLAVERCSEDRAMKQFLIDTEDA